MLIDFVLIPELKVLLGELDVTLKVLLTDVDVLVGSRSIRIPTSSTNTFFNVSPAITNTISLLPSPPEFCTSCSLSTSKRNASCCLPSS